MIYIIIIINMITDYIINMIINFIKKLRLFEKKFECRIHKKFYLIINFL